MLPTEFCFGD